jgi:RNA polymerase sigma-70 factor (ECF subfamily)
MRRDLRLSDHDADDVLQEVLTVVARRVAEFDRQRTGSFRAWLKSITVNCLRAYAKKRRNNEGTGDSTVLELLNQIEDPAADLSQQWDREHDEYVMKQLLDDVRQHFTDTTWLAFQRSTLENAPAETVAAELGMTANAVFIARSRVMTRLRQEAAGLVD